MGVEFTKTFVIPTIVILDAMLLLAILGAIYLDKRNLIDIVDEFGDIDQDEKQLMI